MEMYPDVKPLEEQEVTITRSSFREHPSEVVCDNNRCLSDGMAVWEDRSFRGFWEPPWTLEHINVLELRPVYLSLRAFIPSLQNTFSTCIYTLIWRKAACPWCGWHRRAYALCAQRIFSKMVLRWCKGDKLLNKLVIFVLFPYKKYSRSFIILLLNHWWQMEYSDNVFHTFLGLASVISRFSSKIS